MNEDESMHEISQGEAEASVSSESSGSPRPALLPCPFCGCAAGWRDLDGLVEHKPYERFMVACPLCVVGQSATTLEEAAIKWNTRIHMRVDFQVTASDASDAPLSISNGSTVPLLAEYQEEYERLFNWRALWNQLSNSKRFVLAVQNERIEAKAARANRLIGELIKTWDASAVSSASTPQSKALKDNSLTLTEAVGLNSESNLLPCPKCGSRDLKLRDIGGWEIDCAGCELSLVLANDPSHDGLVSAWNTRASDIICGCGLDAAQIALSQIALSQGTSQVRCPYCDSGLVWTEQESEAIADLSRRLDLRPAQVIRQALRAFQLQTLGEPELHKTALSQVKGE